jgi:hypothetical protein
MSKRLVLAVGAGLLIVGSLMTWISVDLGFTSFSATGFENIEGKLTLGAGVVLVLVALTLGARGNLGTTSNILGAAAAVFGTVVLLLEYVDVRQRIAEAEGTVATATVGLGVWITAIGCAAALAAVSWSVLSQRRANA